MLGKFKGGPRTVHRTSSLDARAFIKEVIEDEYPPPDDPSSQSPLSKEQDHIERGSIKSQDSRGRSQISSGYSTNSSPSTTSSSPPISSSDDEDTKKERRSKSSGPIVTTSSTQPSSQSTNNNNTKSSKTNPKPILKKGVPSNRAVNQQPRPGQKISSDTDSSLPPPTRLDPRRERKEGVKETASTSEDPGGGGGGEMKKHAEKTEKQQQKQPEQNPNSKKQPPDEEVDEATRLRQILMSIDPGDLYHFTIARLSTADPKVVAALNVLLPAIDIEKLASLSLTSSSGGSGDDETSSNSSSDKQSDKHNTTTQTSSGVDEEASEEISSNCDASQASTKAPLSSIDFEEEFEDPDDSSNQTSTAPELISSTSQKTSNTTQTSNQQPIFETHSIVSATSNTALILKCATPLPAPRSTADEPTPLKRTASLNRPPTTVPTPPTPTTATTASSKVQVQHCVRCHKNYNQNAKICSSKAESRCMVAHPEAMVIKTNEDKNGSDFKCVVCGREFRLNVSFYEEGTSSLLTGFCYTGNHSTDPQNVEFRKLGGAAKTCEEHGCVEFYV